MAGRSLRRCGLVLLLGMIPAAGCSDAGKELTLGSFSPSTEQIRIAAFYRQEAARFRQQADELDSRSELYERMFGTGSDWVAGARVLAQSYRHAAEVRERLAKEHLEAIEGSRNDLPPHSFLPPDRSPERTP